MMLLLLKLANNYSEKKIKKPCVGQLEGVHGYCWVFQGGRRQRRWAAHLWDINWSWSQIKKFCARIHLFHTAHCQMSRRDWVERVRPPRKRWITYVSTFLHDNDKPENHQWWRSDHVLETLLGGGGAIDGGSSQERDLDKFEIELGRYCQLCHYYDH